MTDEPTTMPPGKHPTPFRIETGFGPVEHFFHLLLDAIEDVMKVDPSRSAVPIRNGSPLRSAIARVLSEPPGSPTDHALLAAAGAIDLALSQGLAPTCIRSLLPVLGFCRVSGTGAVDRRTAMLLHQVRNLLAALAERDSHIEASGPSGAVVSISERVRVLDVEPA